MTEIVIRPGTADDVDVVADIYIAARALMTYIPPRPEFEPDAVRTFFHTGLLPDYEVRLAEHKGKPVGFSALSETMLDQLYVHPDHFRNGIGKRLLDDAKARRPDGFTLWVIEQNADAIRFYEREGFATLLHTDGSDSMEGLPDRKMGWPASVRQA